MGTETDRHRENRIALFRDELLELAHGEGDGPELRSPEALLHGLITDVREQVLDEAEQAMQEVAAELFRDHNMPPNKDSRSYSFRMGWWEGVHHAAGVVKRARIVANLRDGGETDG